MEVMILSPAAAGMGPAPKQQHLRLADNVNKPKLD